MRPWIMLFPSPLERPLELPTACALTTSADDRSKPVNKINLRNPKFPFMNQCCPFLIAGRYAAAKILNGGPPALCIRGVRTKLKVFLELCDRARVVLLSPVEPAKIVIGHA